MDVDASRTRRPAAAGYMDLQGAVTVPIKLQGLLVQCRESKAGRGRAEGKPLLGLVPMPPTGPGSGMRKLSHSQDVLKSR